MQRILVVDDEADIRDLLSYNLKKEGFDVVTAPDGSSALTIARQERFDLVVLDLMLPNISGIDVCKLLRSDPKLADVPVLMLTAKGEEIDRIVGLEVGADDYMTKPFSPRELVARIKAILRRTAQPARSMQTEAPAPVLHVRDIVIDREEYTVAVHDRPVKLSATEFKLLLYLAERPKKIFSREHLLDAVWGNDVYVEPRTVDVHVRRLRAKIEDDPNEPAYIKTMRGIGYFFEG